MPYYFEQIKREPNHRGKPRLVTALGHLPGVVGHGFNGDGTLKGATLRLWETRRTMPELEGVVKVTKTAFNKAVADREAAKPVPPEPEPTPREEYAAATTLDEWVKILAKQQGLRD